MSLSSKRQRKLSRLTDQQLAMKFDLNILKEAWSELELSRNSVIENLREAVWLKICRKEKEIAKNQKRCARIVKPFMKPV